MAPFRVSSALVARALRVRPGAILSVHFHSEAISVRESEELVGPPAEKDKSFTIIVNAQPKPWQEKEITYEQVVKLAFGDPPPGVVITYTVEYERAHGDKPEGSLVKGGPPAKVKEGMIFSVTETSRS